MGQSKLQTGLSLWGNVNGDTIFYSGVKIRIADIDAPEISEPKCAAEAALGDRAKHRLVELMNAGPFRIVAAGGRDEDVYGRKLRRIERNGRSVADALIVKVWRGGGTALVGVGAAEAHTEGDAQRVVADGGAQARASTSVVTKTIVNLARAASRLRAWSDPRKLDRF